MTVPPLSQSLAFFYGAYSQSVTSAYGPWLRGPVLSYYVLHAVTPELAAPFISGDNVRKERGREGEREGWLEGKDRYSI